MKRVLIIGSGGSGKSTLARRMHAVTGLPLVHLDRLYWRSGWQKTPKDEWLAKIAEVTAADEWILDGNFDGTLDERLARADTVIFLDLPRYLCIYRVIKRRLTYRGTNRPDMSEGCDEKIDAEFLWWLMRYPHVDRRDCEMKIARSGAHVNVIRLRSAAEVRDFLNSLGGL